MQTLTSSATHISESSLLKRSKPSRDLDISSSPTQDSADRTEEHFPFLLESGLTLPVDNPIPDDSLSSELESLPPFDLLSLSDLKFVMRLFEEAGTVLILTDTRLKNSVPSLTTQQSKNTKSSANPNSDPVQNPTIAPNKRIPDPILPASQSRKRKRAPTTHDPVPRKKPKIEEKKGNPEAESEEKRGKKKTSADVISQLVAAKKKEKEERTAALIDAQTEKREKKSQAMRGEEIYADCGLTNVRQKPK